MTTPTTIYLVPKTDFKIPDPFFQGTPGYFLPAEGREVQPSDYWTRRLRDGDVTVGTDPTIDQDTGS